MSLSSSSSSSSSSTSSSLSSTYIDNSIWICACLSRIIHCFACKEHKLSKNSERHIFNESYLHVHLITFSLSLIRCCSSVEQVFELESFQGLLQGRAWKRRYCICLHGFRGSTFVCGFNTSTCLLLMLLLFKQQKQLKTKKLWTFWGRSKFFLSISAFF